jgi:CBS domain-containing protein
LSVGEIIRARREISLMSDQDTLVTPADEVNPLLTAADVMTAAPRTCSKFSTVMEAVLIFQDADCGFVPVVDGGKPIGVLTDRDVALALADFKDALPAMSVGEIMKQGVVTVPSDARLDVVCRTLAEREVRRALVVDDGEQLVGVISLANLAPHMSERGLGGLVHKVIEPG